MTAFAFSNFFFEVARGSVPGLSTLHKFGSNIDVDIGTEDIWEHGGTVGWPASALTMNVSSGDVNDTSAGTGARTLYIEGLDADLLEQSETISLNGQTIVTTANQYHRINRAYVATYGSGEENAGSIHIYTGTATAGHPDDETLTYATIAATQGQTHQAIYTVPSNKELYITHTSVTTDGAAKPLEGSLRVRENILGSESGWRDRHHFKTGDVFNKDYILPLYVPGSSDIKLTVTAEANNTFASGSFDGIEHVIPT